MNLFFLQLVLVKMGFWAQWVHMLMQCISTISFAILIYGVPSPPFWASCGIRQIDPLSPYLFLFVS